MFPCNIESLILDKEQNQKEIEQFYTFELFQYKNLKKLRPCSSFKSMYKIIGKHRYSSKEVLCELEKRFNEYLTALKTEQRKQKELTKPPKSLPLDIPKNVKVTELFQVHPKQNIPTIRERVNDLLRSDMTLSPIDVSQILNINYGTAYNYVSDIRRFEAWKKQRELEKQKEIEERKFMLEFVYEIPVEQRPQMTLYLCSILRNW